MLTLSVDLQNLALGGAKYGLSENSLNIETKINLKPVRGPLFRPKATSPICPFKGRPG